MTKSSDIEKPDSLAEELEADLFKEYGPLLTGDSLRRSLGYPSMSALHQAAARGMVQVPIFKLKDRRGKFALSKDVAKWLAEERNSVTQEKS